MPSTHANPHELAGTTVPVRTRVPLFRQNNNANATVPLLVEDWWDRVTGRSWMDEVGSPACLSYAIRSGALSLPLDNEVVYGHTADGLGHLVHASEIRRGVA